MSPRRHRLGYASITMEFDSSINRALLEEVASYDELDGIEIMTDAVMNEEKMLSTVALTPLERKVIQA